MTAERLLLLYPRRWRKRYGPEFLALLAEQPITWRTLWDVTRAAGYERLVWTRVGRVIAGGLVGLAACGAASMVAAFTSPAIRPRDWHSMIWFLPVQMAPLLVALVMMLAVTFRHGRWRAPGFRTQLIAMTVSTAVMVWSGLESPRLPLDTVWQACAGVAWMFVLLFNVEQTRDPIPLRDRIRRPPPDHPLGLGV